MPISSLLRFSVLCLALTLPCSVDAETFHVGSGPCPPQAPASQVCGDVYGPNGLIAVLRAADRNNVPDEIILEALTYTLTQRDNSADGDGTNGLPNINSVITISTGPLAPGTSPQLGKAVIERATDRSTGAVPKFRILHVSSKGAVGLVNVVLRGGQTNLSVGGIVKRSGGGIFNRGRMTITSSLVDGNSAFRGGGIFNSDNNGGSPAVLVLGRTTVSQNMATSGGGGIENLGALTLVDSTIDGNQNDMLGGGGISNVGTATVENSTISNNVGQNGGGIDNTGTFTITNSTISGNFAFGLRGGGIESSGPMLLQSVTITGNYAVSNGGGIYHTPLSVQPVTVQNTIIAGNFDINGASDMEDSPDCQGEIASRGFNLIGNSGVLLGILTNTATCILTGGMNDQIGRTFPIDPRLNGLSSANGGATATHALMSGSPAIDRGGSCDVIDQRHFHRTVNGDMSGSAECDIGAVEFNAKPDVTNTGRGPTVTIVSDTVLTQDVGFGIVIGQDGITLDCNGHTLFGTGRGAGIELKVRTGVTVRHCSVMDFVNGFNVEDSGENTFIDNTASHNANDGFHIVRSVGNIFNENRVMVNGDDGFDLDGFTANFVRSNHSNENADIGINVDRSIGNFFVGNESLGNGDRGFKVSQGSVYSPFISNRACDNRGSTDFNETSHPNFFQLNDFCRQVGIRPGELIR